VVTQRLLSHCWPTVGSVNELKLRTFWRLIRQRGGMEARELSEKPIAPLARCGRFHSGQVLSTERRDGCSRPACRPVMPVYSVALCTACVYMDSICWFGVVLCPCAVLNFVDYINFLKTWGS
jgi:hypothetical protein